MGTDLISAIVNNTKTISLDKLEGQDIRILERNDSGAKVLFRNKVYSIEVHNTDIHSKSYTLLINNQPINVALKSELDVLIEKLGLNAKKSENLSQLNAPMPGLVLDILVAEGDSISEGDTLLILEAMKMENVIKASGEAQVKEVLVNKGDKVDKGQILIDFE